MVELHAATPVVRQFLHSLNVPSDQVPVGQLWHIKSSALADETPANTRLAVVKTFLNRIFFLLFFFYFTSNLNEPAGQSSTVFRKYPAEHFGLQRLSSAS